MRKRKPEEPKVGAPAYIVTFSDMITLLLTFFVMLISMAKHQTEGLFGAGQNSFRQAVSNFGLSGSIVKRSSGPQFEHQKKKYHANDSQDKNQNRSIDAQTEMLRRTILELEDTMKISPSHITGTSKTFTVADIHFAKGSWSLNGSAKQYLDKYSRQMSASFSGEPVTIYIVGLAGDEPGEKQQWTVSSHRARQVASHIKNILPDNNNWKVYSWGAGPGGEWTGVEGIANEKTDILIVALTE